MQVTTIADFRQNPEHFLDAALDNVEPIIVARDGARNVVIISEETWNSMRGDTEYLLASPANARRLAQSEEAIQRGELIYKSLEDL